MNNLLEAFPMLDDELKENLDFSIEATHVYYNFENNIRNLSMIPINNDTYHCYLDDEYGVWNPLEHNLNITLHILLKNKNILFDASHGIADSKSILGLAITWYCKKTNQIETKHLQDILLEDKNEIAIDYTLNFKEGELANQLSYKLIIYLKDVSLNNSFLQNTGMILGDLEEYTITLEGDGSIFPIELFENNKEILWRASFNYTDIYEDEFNKDNICLYLNQIHKDYFNLNIDENGKLSPLMKEVLSNFFFLFMKDLEEKGVNLNELSKADYSEIENSIANVAKYWISYLNIDFSSSLNMAMSIRKSINLL